MKLNFAEHYSQFPHSALIEKEGRLYGCWMVGNKYDTPNKYYGGYPRSYLERVRSLFFYDNCRVLHLFSGKVEARIGEVTFDINPSLRPDVVGNAEYLSDYFQSRLFDIIVADPPYTPEDAAKYGTKMPVGWKVFRQMRKIVPTGGTVIWLDTRRPMCRKEEWRLAGLISLDCSTNRRIRGVFIYEAI